MLWDDVEVSSAAAFAAKHQNGIASLLGADRIASLALLHFALEFLKSLHNAHHLFEGVFAAMLQTYVRGFPQDFNPQGYRATVGVPNHAAGRLGQEHADSIAPQQSLPSEPIGAASTSSLFIGNQGQRDSSVQLDRAFAKRAHGVQHRDDAAFHIAGPAP